MYNGDALVIPELYLDADESVNIPSDVIRAMRATQVRSLQLDCRIKCMDFFRWSDKQV